MFQNFIIPFGCNIFYTYVDILFLQKIFDINTYFAITCGSCEVGSVSLNNRIIIV